MPRKLLLEHLSYVALSRQLLYTLQLQLIREASYYFNVNQSFASTTNVCPVSFCKWGNLGVLNKLRIRPASSCYNSFFLSFILCLCKLCQGCDIEAAAADKCLPVVRAVKVHFQNELKLFVRKLLVNYQIELSSNYRNCFLQPCPWAVKETRYFTRTHLHLPCPSI